MKQIKPIPYYTLNDHHREKEIARELRRIFVPRIRRRFAMHYLSGFKHDAIVQYTALWKKEYPFFLRTDIECFYPNCQVHKLIAQVQIAYRDLYGLRHVPRKFKEQYLPVLFNWSSRLPAGSGIPLGSCVSSIISAIALIPTLLALKHNYNVRIIVYADDILLFCKSDQDCRKVWHYLQESLSVNLDLRLNPAKTKSGSFSSQSVDFCGWSFRGGYARISTQKINHFKDRIHAHIARSKRENTRAFIKTLNSKIDGFGNYYKYGNVCRIFDELDAFVRSEVRWFLTGNYHSKIYRNEDLEKLGLHSLRLCYEKVHVDKSTKQVRIQPVENYYQKKPAAPDYGTLNQIAQNSEKIVSQLSQIISFQRRLNHDLKEVLQYT